VHAFCPLVISHDPEAHQPSTPSQFAPPAG
jgi:hypothetical protein